MIPYSHCFLLMYMKTIQKRQNSTFWRWRFQVYKVWTATADTLLLWILQVFKKLLWTFCGTSSEKNFPNFTRALSADGLLSLSSHSAWLPANACVWQLPMVFLTCIYLSQIRGSWAILGRQLTNSLFSNL